MQNWATADGRIHGAFKYHGAATGRWTSFGVQFQNLKKQNGLDTEAAIARVSAGNLAAMRKYYADPLAVVGEVARAAVIAATGHRLIMADFSGIESRVLAYIAGEQWKIEQWAKFDQTGDPKDEPYFVTGKGFGFDDDTARTPGKTGDLAFGYMGGLGAWRKFAGDELPDQEVERLKRAWRAAHPNVVKLWAQLDGQAKRAVANPTRVQRVNRHLAFCFDGTFLRLKLPSGRCVAYPFARLEDNARGDRVVMFKDNAQGKFVDCRHGHGAWPGLWTENAVQAVARDLLREGMLRLDAAGYLIALHVHDEVVAEVPDGFGSEDDFLRILTAVPSWATGLPIAAKARSGRRFCKINAPSTEPDTGTADVPFDDPVDIGNDDNGGEGDDDQDDFWNDGSSNPPPEPEPPRSDAGRDWQGYQSGAREINRIACPVHGGEDQNCAVYADGHGHCFSHCGYIPADEMPDAAESVPQTPQPATKTLKLSIRLWQATVPIRGTLAERYLLETRGLDLATLPGIDAVLRFHPRCPFDGNNHPCVIALFRDVETDEIAGIHRIALTAGAEKIDRMMLGSWPRPRAIKLRAGNDQLVAGEGIETVIAGAMRRADTSSTLWALGSAGAVEKLPLVPGFTGLTVLVDREASNVGLDNARACTERWRRAGRKTCLAVPHQANADFNDLINPKRA
jgi:hypothetical protein